MCNGWRDTGHRIKMRLDVLERGACCPKAQARFHLETNEPKKAFAATCVASQAIQAQHKPVINGLCLHHVWLRQIFSIVYIM